jgi:hypothetical protein
MWRTIDTYHDSFVAKATMGNDTETEILEAGTQNELEEKIEEFLTQRNGE